MRMVTSLAVLAVAALSTQAFALDPGASLGVGGRSPGVTPMVRPLISMGSYQGTTGPSVAVAGGRGVGAGIGSGGSGPITEVGKLTGGGPPNVVGKGRTTMEVVPGRSPTYIDITAGRRGVDPLGGRGM